MKSMTGFGKSEGVIGGYVLSIEIKSLNHRYLDIRTRLPPPLTSWELPIQEEIRRHCERGAFDVVVRQKTQAQSGTVSTGTKYAVDPIAAESWASSCEWLSKKFGTEKKLTLSHFLSAPKVIVPVEEPWEASQHLADFLKLLKTAIDEVDGMRKREGAHLKELLSQGIREVQALAQKLASLSGGQVEEIRTKLQTRIRAITSGQSIDAQRLELEVALLADRSEISEETDRLSAHSQEFLTLLGTGKPMGRKLDFITQELHREMNTLGSKAALLELNKLTVEGKVLVEKLREQVQNVE